MTTMTRKDIQVSASTPPIQALSIKSNYSTPSEYPESDINDVISSSIQSYIPSRESFDDHIARDHIRNKPIRRINSERQFIESSNSQNSSPKEDDMFSVSPKGGLDKTTAVGMGGTELFAIRRKSTEKLKLLTTGSNINESTQWNIAIGSTYQDGTVLPQHSRTCVRIDDTNRLESSQTSFSWSQIASAVVFWYFSSMAITATLKSLFDNLGFTYPLLVTFTHFTLISLFLQLGIKNCSFCSGSPQISPRNYVMFIVPIAFFSATEIALSNLAYSMVSLSVMTVIKSSLVVVTYLFSVCFGLERFSGKLLAAVMLIVGSITLTVPGLEIKNGIGVLILCIAVLLAAARWVVVHHQLQEHKYTPLQLMVLTQPLSAVFLAAPAAAVDARSLIETELETPDPEKFMAAVTLIGVTVILAFLVIFAEYNLVRVTSSVSLTVAGIGKEVATILMSVMIFGESIDLTPSIGITCSVLGIILYSLLRLRQSHSDSIRKELQRLPSSESEEETLEVNHQLENEDINSLANRPDRVLRSQRSPALSYAPSTVHKDPRDHYSRSEKIRSIGASSSLYNIAVLSPTTLPASFSPPSIRTNESD